MAERADAHIHLFAGGYRGGSFTDRAGVAIDEAACYDSLAREHGISAALVVGYAAEAWCADNNRHVEAAAAQYQWARPLAFFDAAAPPGVADLDRWRERGFVGISLYLFTDAATAAMGRWPAECWQWLAERRWLVSVNSRAQLWAGLEPVLRRHPELRLLISHLGLPPAVATPPGPELARQELSAALALAAYPGVRVKLSGFYAVSHPGYAFPHEPAWPYVEALVERFGARRLLWGSDFPPHLDRVTFPQAIGVIERMPFFDPAARAAVEGGNLHGLLREVH